MKFTLPATPQLTPPPPLELAVPAPISLAGSPVTASESIVINAFFQPQSLNMPSQVTPFSTAGTITFTAFELNQVIGPGVFNLVLMEGINNTVITLLNPQATTTPMHYIFASNSYPLSDQYSVEIECLLGGGGPWPQGLVGTLTYTVNAT